MLAEVGLPVSGLPDLLAGVDWAVDLAAKRIAWPERGIVVGLLAAWVALAVHHLVDKLYVNNIYVHLGAMIGLLQLFAWSASDREVWLTSLQTSGAKRLIRNVQNDRIFC
ncbi:MAG: hypothetical protein H6663_03980 [Candidatus Promineofilum sp.]|nr:hypothetical protein [Promineifilum sp.]